MKLPQRNVWRELFSARNTNSFLRAMLGVALAWFGAVPTAHTSGINTTDPNLPPSEGVYLTASAVHATFSGFGLQIVLQDVQHQPFAGTTVRKIVGGDEQETFDSLLNANASINGGPLLPVQLIGPVTVDLFGKAGNVLGTFSTEMLQMNLSGTFAGNPLMVRESPTLASTGQTSISNLGGGMYHIDSFFDIFTEISIDGGATWIPSDGSTHVALAAVPEPGMTGLLAVFGGIAAVIRGSKASR